MSVIVSFVVWCDSWTVAVRQIIRGDEKVVTSDQSRRAVFWFLVFRFSFLAERALVLHHILGDGSSAKGSSISQEKNVFLQGHSPKECRPAREGPAAQQSTDMQRSMTATMIGMVLVFGSTTYARTHHVLDVLKCVKENPPVRPDTESHKPRHLRHATFFVHGS